MVLEDSLLLKKLTVQLHYFRLIATQAYKSWACFKPL
jgi:hypothetical protein